MPLNFTYILPPLSALFSGVFKMARKISVLTDLNCFESETCIRVVVPINSCHFDTNASSSHLILHGKKSETCFFVRLTLKPL